jgi:hypothetical protein
MPNEIPDGSISFVDRAAVGHGSSVTVILELNQTLWMMTPKGEALAMFLTDMGAESDHLWTCVQQEGEFRGQMWTWHNSQVRLLDNQSMLRNGG